VKRPFKWRTSAGVSNIFDKLGVMLKKFKRLPNISKRNSRKSEILRLIAFIYNLIQCSISSKTLSKTEICLKLNFKHFICSLGFANFSSRRFGSNEKNVCGKQLVIAPLQYLTKRFYRVGPGESDTFADRKVCQTVLVVSSEIINCVPRARL